MNDDSQLREHFNSLREADAALAPSFAKVMRPGLARSQPRYWGLVVGASAALIAVSVVTVSLLRPHGPVTSAVMAPMLADWRSPTDFLLDTPGRALLHTIPDLGRFPSTGVDPIPSTRTNTPAPRAGREHS
jgi:hypothetical protein